MFVYELSGYGFKLRCCHLCIDLVFTNQPHLVMESRVHNSLSSTCHHEILFANFSLKFEYPPPYRRILWDYSRADKGSINRAINAIDWEKLYANKTMESQVFELNDLLLNIYPSYIPNKTVLCDDKDHPLIAVPKHTGQF